MSSSKPPAVPPKPKSSSSSSSSSATQSSTTSSSTTSSSSRKSFSASEQELIEMLKDGDKLCKVPRSKFDQPKFKRFFVSKDEDSLCWESKRKMGDRSKSMLFIYVQWKSSENMSVVDWHLLRRKSLRGTMMKIEKLFEKLLKDCTEMVMIRDWWTNWADEILYCVL